MGFLHSGDGGLATHPANRSYTAISVAAGIDMTANTQAYSATAGIINIWNQSRVANPSRNVVIIPRKIDLTVMQVNTSATDYFIDFYRDTSNRWASGGTLLTANNTAFDEPDDFPSPASVAQIYIGALVLSGAGDLERVMWRSMPKSAIGIAGERITILFGSDGIPHDEVNTDVTGVDAVVHVPPIWLGRNQNLSIHGYGTSMTNDPKFKVQVWYEEFDAEA